MNQWVSCKMQNILKRFFTVYSGALYSVVVRHSLFLASYAYQITIRRCDDRLADWHLSKRRRR